LTKFEYKKKLSMKLSLIYFDFPFWRAEVARLSLFIGNIHFDDVRISNKEFKRVKTEGKLDNGTIIPFHQLPCLLIDNYSIVQTGAISRYCGKLSNLYPSDKNIIAARIDQYIDILTDITVIITSTKQEDRNDIFVNEVLRKLYILDKSIDSKYYYLVENYFSIADIALWSFACWFSNSNIKGISSREIKNFKNIIKICLLVDQHPKINEWINKNFPKSYKRNLS